MQMMRRKKGLRALVHGTLWVEGNNRSVTSFCYSRLLAASLEVDIVPIRRNDRGECMEEQNISCR